MVNAVHRTRWGTCPTRRCPAPSARASSHARPASATAPSTRRSSPIACGRIPPACWSPRDRFETAGSGTRTSIRGMPTSPRPGSSARRRRRSSPSGRSTVIPRAARLLLSQTPWVNVATLPPGKDDGVVPRLKIFPADGYAADDVPAADTDSGGWPQSAGCGPCDRSRPRTRSTLRVTSTSDRFSSTGWMVSAMGLRFTAGGREHVAASVDAVEPGATAGRCSLCR